MQFDTAYVLFNAIFLVPLIIALCVAQRRPKRRDWSVHQRQHFQGRK